LSRICSTCKLIKRKNKKLSSMNKSCKKKNQQHSQHILHVDVLYNIKRKKYQTVCAELAFAKSPSTEWSWFCIEIIIRFLYLLCSWIIAIFKECLNKSRKSKNIKMWIVNGRQTTNERRRSDDKSSHCLWQGELTTVIG
jgi:hypothetical protein